MEHTSVLDIFKIGIGPSSSHTMGPWKAALRFIEILENQKITQQVFKINIHLYGSLALTGKGHGTVEALLLGLSGYLPEDIHMTIAKKLPNEIREKNLLHIGGSKAVNFVIDEDIQFDFETIPTFHSNGLSFEARNEGGTLLQESTFYSIGGGFVVLENDEQVKKKVDVPYPITFARDLKAYCASTGKNLSWIIRQNEMAWRSVEELESSVMSIYNVMLNTVYRGCHTQGILPGGLKVQRRAPHLLQSISKGKTFENVEQFTTFLKTGNFSFSETLKIVSCLAIATNEENADFGRVVTAPTNGAAGVIPAVLMYHVYLGKESKDSKKEIIDFFCVAAEIGSIFKKKSTISAAMGGCQAEIGVSAAMAAAGLTYVLGGKVDQVLMAAEIAMEHHLGMTCDPIKGLVQVPCIERNSMGAIKAITAAQLALGSDPTLAKVSLDDVVKTMWETAKDMNLKYKETALGGLATNSAVSIPEC